jgi:hypothetical protein
MFQGCGQPRIVTWTKEELLWKQKESEMATKIFGGSQHGGYGAGMSQGGQPAVTLGEAIDRAERDRRLMGEQQMKREMLKEQAQPETDIARQMGRLQGVAHELGLVLCDLVDALAPVSLQADDGVRVDSVSTRIAPATPLGGEIGRVADALQGMHGRALDAKRRLQLP